MDIKITKNTSLATFNGIHYNTDNPIINAVFNAIGNVNINIDMISFEALPDGKIDFGFTFSDDDLNNLLPVLKSVASAEKITTPMISMSNVKITVSDPEMVYRAGFAAGVFSKLFKNNVTPLLITTALDEISILVRESDFDVIENDLQ